MENIDEINNLLLGISDINGLSIFGYIINLIKLNKLDNIKNIIALDAGALVGLLLASKFTINEMLDILINLNPLHQNNINSNIFNNHGLLSEDYLINYFNSIFINKFDYIPTLKTLYDINNIKITFVTYNITKGVTEYINYDTYPNISCVLACILSYVKPIIYNKIKYKDNLYIGGIVGNVFPIEFIESIINNQNTKIYSISSLPINHGNNSLFDYINMLFNSIVKNYKNLALIYNINVDDTEIMIDNKLYLIGNTNISDKYKTILDSYNISKRKYHK